MVAITASGERLVGRIARRQAVTNPENTVFSIKRFMGRRFDDPAVQRDKALVPYQMRKANNGSVEVKMGDRWHTPEEVSSMILAKLKADAEAYLGDKVDRAEISVPAAFGDAQRNAMRDACRIAWLTPQPWVTDTAAAALAYGCTRPADEQIADVAFGAGHTSISF